MVNAVEFLIGLTIGAGVVALYYFIKSRRGPLPPHQQGRLKQAITVLWLAGGLAVIGEIAIRVMD